MKMKMKKIKNFILGLCIFSYQFIDNLLKLNISHISTLNPQSLEEEKEKEENNINNNNICIDILKKVFNKFFDYIKKNFYFDEIILEYNSTKINEQILSVFINDLNFVIDNVSENEINNNKNIYNKMIYTNDSSKNRVDVLVRESIVGYLNKNIFDVFDSMLVTNDSKLSSLENKNKEEPNLINNFLMKYLLEKKKKLMLIIYIIKLQIYLN